MNARDELLDALTAERYDNRWWVTRDDTETDDELTTARRRKAMGEEFEHGHKEAAS